MVKMTANQEKDAVDIVTDTLYSISFLEAISKTIFDPNRNNIEVGTFYNQWLEATAAHERKIPFNLGVFSGYLFVGILFTKENWADLIPDEKVEDVSPDWGLVGVSYVSPEHPSPKLKHFIRRLRNALGHASFFFEIPNDLHSIDELHSRINVVFQDQNPKNPSDVFETRLTLTQLKQLIKKFQSLVHKDVANKYGLKNP